MQQVIVNISPDGEVKVEAAGVAGSGCQQLTKAIEDALGRATADVKKPEFYQSQVQQQAAGQAARLGAK
jgi:acylphosphatase